ncbi:MAG: hypothetical protein KDA96_03890 [Planctomycetaceae bacterium]|nr:hypothetical protein [Planctomycetaceae bacterium]
MAIEFQCPYCTATIRVADQYAGRKGQCPKCQTKLLVPTLPGQTSDLANGAPSPSESAASTSQAETMPEIDRTTVTSVPIDPTAATASQSLPVSDLFPGGVPGGSAESPIPPVIPSTTASVARVLKKRNRRSRSRRIWVMVIPAISFLALLGFLGYTISNTLPEVGGNLEGRRMRSPTAMTVLVPWSDTGLSPDDQSALQEDLTQSPEVFASDQVSCRITADKGGLVVEFEPGADHSWIVIQPLSDRATAVWEKQHKAELNIARLGELDVAVQDYAADKVALLKGERRKIDATRYRNKLAVNAHCNAMGFAVQAQVGNRLYPCVHQDDLGQLYFSLPSNTIEFHVQGRTGEGGNRLFPGEFLVTVSADSPADPSEQQTDSPTDSDQESREEPDMTTPNDSAPTEETGNEEMKTEDATESRN